MGSNFQRGRSPRYRSDRELSLGMIRRRIQLRRSELDSIWCVAANLVDSLSTGDTTLVGLKKLLKEGAARRIPELKKLSKKLFSLPRGEVSASLNDPKLRLGSLIREADFSQRRIAALKVEAWKKISIPFASLVFVLLGAPLGIITRRGGAGVSIAISMGIFLVYWIFLISGETLADRMLISPFWAMWTPNFFFLAAGCWLLVVQIHGKRSLAVARSGLQLNISQALRKILSLRSSQEHNREHQP